MLKELVSRLSQLSESKKLIEEEIKNVQEGIKQELKVGDSYSGEEGKVTRYTTTRYKVSEQYDVNYIEAINPFAITKSIDLDAVKNDMDLHHVLEKSESDSIKFTPSKEK